MKASEIVDKLKSVLLSTEEEPQVELSEVEVNEAVELAEYEDKMEDEVVDEVKEVKEVEYVSKDDFKKAVAEIKAMYDALVEKMGSKDMGMEVPTEDLGKEELSSQEDGAEPIAHAPETKGSEFQIQIFCI
jgi:N12 class adenine-specific DNA methylase